MSVGYAPTQPVPYSHALHAGKLGIDCRYCHNTVEKTAFASLPATQTCMNCHTKIRTDSEFLKPVRDSWATGEPIKWIKIHNLANYVYFNHSAHVSHGVGCVECHGRIDRMDIVFQAAPLSMGWCLDCHRAPESHLRPKDQITNMDWKHPGRRRNAAEELGHPVEAAVSDSRHRIHDQLLHVPPMNHEQNQAAVAKGASYWRSLAHLADSPEMQEMIGKEFPGYDVDEMLGPVAPELPEVRRRVDGAGGADAERLPSLA